MSKGSLAESIGTETLTEFVQFAVGSDKINVGKWRRQLVHGGGGTTTGGLYRFEGLAHTDDANLETGWSLIMKVIRRPYDAGASAEWSDWRREALAYSSGTLRHLPSGVAAPRCFGIREKEQETWLWLEDVTELPNMVWGLDDYETAARHLGRFNGYYLSAGPLPFESWWSEKWLRGYVGLAAAEIDRLPFLLEHPLVNRLFPDESAKQVIQFLADRNEFLNFVERLPRTFCHLDANRRNLFFRPDGRGRQELVLVDWSLAGIGAVGEEVAALIVGSVLLYGLEPADLPELEARVLAAYVAALRESGWHGNEREVWLGFAVSTALRYTAYSLVRLPILLDERHRAWAERAIGQSIESFVDRVVAMRGYLLGLAAEAKKYV